MKNTKNYAFRDDMREDLILIFHLALNVAGAQQWRRSKTHNPCSEALAVEAGCRWFESRSVDLCSSLHPFPVSSQSDNEEKKKATSAADTGSREEKVPAGFNMSS
ncbi:hypothetical protein ILYODFUR_013360 [Ilyodon furcidens]|uniref:Uncharacterized protein n=1 Tax=Ilyodon furcidens TaxID=33524 RepID=A0ABV0SMJ6_9TELE